MANPELATVWDVAGPYALNAYVEIGGWKGLGETVTFSIYEKYK